MHRLISQVPRSSSTFIGLRLLPHASLPFTLKSSHPHMTRRIKSSNAKNSNGSAKQNGKQQHSHDDHHGHSHSMFSMHSHSHGEDGHGADMGQIIEAMKGAGDRGSRITLIGLFANVGLTASKAGAGYMMHSASLMADAAHSLSDLLGDFVTLFCWKLSRKPPSTKYPYGFAKFETLGTTIVSLMLIGGSLGIGFHSYHLLLPYITDALAQTAAAAETSIVHDGLLALKKAAEHVPAVGHDHGHEIDILNPNAAYFAALSVVAKEWLYRITKKVADEENSPVLMANAIHHRSDAYSSVVALFAILGTWLFPHLPLDPIGGIIVAVVILRQGIQLLNSAFGDLTDASVTPQTFASINKTVEKLQEDGQVPEIQGISYVRAKRSGSQLFVDLTVDVRADLTVGESTEVTEKVTAALKQARNDVQEVAIRYRGVGKS